jgi:hypothetical protein
MKKSQESEKRKLLRLVDECRRYSFVTDSQCYQGMVDNRRIKRISGYILNKQKKRNCSTALRPAIHELFQRKPTQQEKTAY